MTPLPNAQGEILSLTNKDWERIVQEDHTIYSLINFYVLDILNDIAFVQIIKNNESRYFLNILDHLQVKSDIFLHSSFEKIKKTKIIILNSIYVPHHCRRNGLGSFLLKWAKDVARIEKSELIIPFSDLNNDLYRFYESAGFIKSAPTVKRPSTIYFLSM
ncbi:GNAT family N-acetyltransferase [Labrys portucalensis]|uniref:GNAT family N-acetyltransferase n=1 Tax=Labrys neptuniae TaxID=376174 RepID=A0ABV6ZP44_9HYPH